MTSYKFTSNTKYFRVTDINQCRVLPLEGLVLTCFTSDNQKLFLTRDENTNRRTVFGFVIDLSVDSVDVDGVTTFANTDALIDVLAPIIFY